MPQKIYLNILRAGVYLSLLSVFFVFKSLLFPFITSKQIPFNILIEVLLVFWAVFIIKYPDYRPKKSYISFGLLAFFAIMVVSCLTGVDFNLSFWGDVERMLGAFHILHFLGLYFIVITVFREWKDWRILFAVSVIFAVIESFKVIDGKHHYGTIGNTAYVSGYFIFNIYFSLILFFREKNKIFKWLYIVPILIMLFGFKAANTSGAYVGLGFSILLAPFFYALFSRSKKVKLFGLAIFLALAVFVGVVFVNKDSNFVKNNSLLAPIRGVNIAKDTFQTRLISWRAAIKDFKNHPILGTGHGNYAIIFDKHFDPVFYEYTSSETYFDRAHNNLIDIASTTGLAGLAAYLFIFLAVAYYLIKNYYKNRISLLEFVLIACLLVAYFVQNLAVFDSLVTYIALMIVLAYVFWLSHREEDPEPVKDRKLENKEIYAFVAIGVIMLAIIYQYNIKPWNMLVGTIDGQRVWAGGQAVGTVEAYQKALSHNTVLDRDSRTSLIRLFISNPNILKKESKEKKQEILDYLIKQAKANVDYNKHDSLNQMMLAQILNAAANYNTDNPEKFEFYSSQAMEAINKSIEASPGRIPIYYQKAQFYLARNEKEKAIENLRYAISLNPNYHEPHCQLGRTLLFFGNEEEAYKSIDKCIDLGGAGKLRPATLIKSLINHYSENKDLPRMIRLYEILARQEKKNAKNWINLAKLYADNKQIEKARQAANKAIELDPAVKKYAEEFISGLSK